MRLVGDWSGRPFRAVSHRDDKSVIARGGNYQNTTRLATIGVVQVIRRIEPTVIKVGGDNGGLGSCHMKYLGLILDRQWCFKEYFTRLAAPKFLGVASALARIAKFRWTFVADGDIGVNPVEYSLRRFGGLLNRVQGMLYADIAQGPPKQPMHWSEHTTTSHG